MAEQNQNIRGAGGLFGGGGGGNAPKTAETTITTDATARILFAACQGEIAGIKNLYFNGVSVFGGTFEGFHAFITEGTQDQPPIDGFPAVETPISVGVEVTKENPYVHTVYDEDVRRVVVTIDHPALANISKKGDRTEASVTLKFSVSDAAGHSYSRTITTTEYNSSGFQKQVRLKLGSMSSKGSGSVTHPVDVKIERLSENADERYVSKTSVSTITEIIDAKLSYPGIALVGVEFDSKEFGSSLPTIHYEGKGLICLVPSNYDPIKRTYSGVWTGTFKRAWTNNPVWIIYTLLVEPDVGRGDQIKPDQVDKWAFYKIAKWCDELVPDGAGGQEPRFCCNGVIWQAKQALETLNEIAALFYGRLIALNGLISLLVDSPEMIGQRSFAVANANVSEAGFHYSGTGGQARFNRVNVRYSNPKHLYELDGFASYEDVADIAKNGLREKQIDLPLCSSYGQARRHAMWIVESECKPREVVTYQAGLDHAGIQPGDIVMLSDANRIGRQLSGRLATVAGATVELDQAVDLEGVGTAHLICALGGGRYEAEKIISARGKTLKLANPISARVGAVWLVVGSAFGLRRFKVLDVAKGDGDEKLTVKITALEIDPELHFRLDNGAVIEGGNPYLLPESKPPKAPENLNVNVEYSKSLGGLEVHFTWRQPDRDAARWEVQELAGGKWVARGETASADWRAQLSGAVSEARSLRVRAIGLIAGKSAWSEKNFRVPTSALRPPNCLSIDLFHEGDKVKLVWEGDHSKVPISHYVIRYSSSKTGTWAHGKTLIADTKGNQGSFFARAGAYMVKAVSIYGEESEGEIRATTSYSARFNQNVIEVIEAPNWGAKKDTWFYNGYLRLNDAGNFFQRDAFFEMKSFFGDGYVSEGWADIPNPLDLGAPYQCRIFHEFDYVIQDPHHNFFTEDYFTGNPWFSDTSDKASVELQISVDGGEWNRLQDGEYLGRVFSFRVLMESFDGETAPLVEKVKIIVDMPDRIEAVNAVTSAEGLVAVEWPNGAFAAVPQIADSFNDLEQGEQTIITNITRAGCKIGVRDQNGAFVAREFNLIAKGYGRSWNN